MQHMNRHHDSLDRATSSPFAWSLHSPRYSVSSNISHNKHENNCMWQSNSKYKHLIICTSGLSFSTTLDYIAFFRLTLMAPLGFYGWLPFFLIPQGLSLCSHTLYACKSHWSSSFSFFWLFIIFISLIFFIFLSFLHHHPIPVWPPSAFAKVSLSFFSLSPLLYCRHQFEKSQNPEVSQLLRKENWDFPSPFLLSRRSKRELGKKCVESLYPENAEWVTNYPKGRLDMWNLWSRTYLKRLFVTLEEKER